MGDVPSETHAPVGRSETATVLAETRKLVDGLARHYAELSNRLEADGAPIDRVVEARVTAELLPGAVTVFPTVDMVLVRVHLGSTPSDSIESITQVSEIADDAERNGWEMMSDAPTQSVWIAVREQDQLARSAFLFSSMLNDQVAVVGYDRMMAASAKRTDQLEAGGFREVSLPEPTGTPDERWTLWTGPAGEIGVPVEELVRTAAGWRLLTAVPDDIEGLVQLSRLLYIFGWERWEFFTVAEQQALLALQAAQELAFDTWLENEPWEISARQRDGRRIILDEVARRVWALRREASARRLRDVRAGSVVFQDQ